MTDCGLPLQKGIVYGPVNSRRLGNSLGLNLSPDEIKMCSLNCSYCQYSWTGLLVRDANPFSHLLPTPRKIEAALRERIVESLDLGLQIDSITFSGNGEPTLHPDFPEIADLVVAARNSLVPGARVCCLSNSTTLDRKDIFDALCRIDDPLMKLDAGNEEMFARLNRPAREVSFPDIVAALANFKGHVTLQSLFVRGAVDNSSEAAVSACVETVKKIAPKAVQIYSLDRIPADRKLEKVPRETLEEIKERIEMEANVFVAVY